MLSHRRYVSGALCCQACTEVAGARRVWCLSPLSVCHLAQASYVEAKEYFTQAERISPGFWKMNLVMLGKCELKLNNNEGALEFFKVWDLLISVFSPLWSGIHVHSCRCCRCCSPSARIPDPTANIPCWQKALAVPVKTTEDADAQKEAEAHLAKLQPKK